MRSFSVALILAVLLACSSFSQQKPAATSGSHTADTQNRSHAPAMRADHIQSLREDLTRMKALVQQMQTNLGFVDTSQSALKHQFQLEIEMWQTLISQMERRLAEPPAR